MELDPANLEALSNWRATPQELGRAGDALAAYDAAERAGGQTGSLSTIAAIFCAKLGTWQVEAAVAKIPVLRLEIFKRSDDLQGFVVLRRRWIIERTFCWFGRNRRSTDGEERSRNSLTPTALNQRGSQSMNKKRLMPLPVWKRIYPCYQYAAHS